MNIISPEEFEEDVRRRGVVGLLLTIDEAARAAVRSRRTIYNALSAGELARIGRGRATRINLWEIHRWLNSPTTKPSVAKRLAADHLGRPRRTRRATHRRKLAHGA